MQMLLVLHNVWPNPFEPAMKMVWKNMCIEQCNVIKVNIRMQNTFIMSKYDSYRAYTAEIYGKKPESKHV